MSLKILHALGDKVKKQDTKPTEKLINNQVRLTIEEYCERYLKKSDDILQFEALPSAIDSTLEVLESHKFQEKYEFSQQSETLFLVRLRELDIL